MGFFQDNAGSLIGSVIAPLTGGLSTIPGALHDQARIRERPGGPQRLGHDWTGERSGPDAVGTDDLSNLLVSTFGPHGDEFKGVFAEAYNRLGQPNEAINPLQVGGTVLQMGDAFAKQYKNATGQLPTPEMLKEYVGATLDIPTAQGFIQGTINPAQSVQTAKKYVASDPSVAATNQGRMAEEARRSQDATINEQNRLLSEYIRGQVDEGTADMNQQYDRQRGRMIDELGSGITNPNSRIGLDNLDQERGENISSMIGKIRSGGAQAGFNAAGQASQFGQTLGLENKKLDLNQSNLSDQIKMLKEQQSYDRGQNLREEDLATRLGREKAKAMEPGTLDYINTGANVIGSFGKVMGGFK